ncbi:MAG: hypothetical protein Q9218_006377 [Villophora microphyllina]
MNELARIAAASVGSEFCLNVKKHAEGQHNKVYLVTTNDGKEVIAKVPHPIFGRPYFTTASEVATMDYVRQLASQSSRAVTDNAQARNILGLPVPKVHAWDPNASTNTVGAEYIIMEKAPGVNLRKIWPDLERAQRLQILESMIQFQKAFTSSTFGAIGSLYYAEQLGAGISSIAVEKQGQKPLESTQSFVLGPTTDFRFLVDERYKMDCDWGPWSCVEDYLEGIGTRELKYVESLTRFPQAGVGIFGGPGWLEPTKADKLTALQDYIKVSRYLAPRYSPATVPVLWHSDLHLSNIYVNPDEPTRITCIIDWQSTHVAPLFYQVETPEFLDFQGPKYPRGLDMEVDVEFFGIPSNISELLEDEQNKIRKEALVLSKKRSLYKMYELYCLCDNYDAYEAFRFQETTQGALIFGASRVAYHSEIPMRKWLMRLEEGWNTIPGYDKIPCPVHYSKQEREAHAEVYEYWGYCIGMMEDILKRLGGQPDYWDGSVSHEAYPYLKEMLKRVRRDFVSIVLETVDGTDEERNQLAETLWPFKDQDEGDVEVGCLGTSR